MTDSHYNEIVLALEHIKEELNRDHLRLDSIDDKLDNHVTHIEHRLTTMETILGKIGNVDVGVAEVKTTLKNLWWVFGILLVAVVGNLGAVISIMLGG